MLIEVFGGYCYLRRSLIQFSTAKAIAVWAKKEKHFSTWFTIACIGEMGILYFSVCVIIQRMCIANGT